MFHRLKLIVAGWLLSASAAGAPLPELARDPSWLKLLHYEDRVGRGLRSRATNTEFFFSVSGTPEDELTAFAAAAADPHARTQPFGRHPQCAFPARFAWLKQFVPGPYPDIACPEFDEWRERLDVRGVRLVFASAFANNPASMFGHTLLKFVGAPGKPELLDYAVTFLASIEEGDDPFSYAWKGLAGGYTASYQLDPYYMSVSLYTRGESRDLWEYDLSLRPEARERLVMHLWEVLFQARFTYYFLDENCSYMLLALLEAADPSWSWTQKQNLFVLPLETLRGMGAPLGSTPKFRPSSRRDFEAAFARLDADERETFFTLRNRRDPSDLTRAPTAVLDALAAAASHERFEKKMQVAAADQERFNDLLRARAARGAPTETEKPTPPAPPLAGHKPRAIMLGGAWEHERPASFLRYRYGLHDFLDSPAGYESFAVIRYFELGLRYQPHNQKLYLDDSRLVDVTSLRPWSRLNQEWSWRLSLGADRIREPICTTCVAASGEAAGGLSAHLGRPELVGFVMGLYRHEAARVFQGWQRFGPGFLAGLTAATRPWRMHAEARFMSETWRPQTYVTRSGAKRTRAWRTRYDVVQAFTVTKDVDLRIEATFMPLDELREKDYRDARVSTVVFF